MIQPSSAPAKEDYDRYVAKATILLHDPNTTASIQGVLSGKDPVQEVAHATVMVMQRLDTAARTAGVEVQDAVKLAAANDIVRLVAELGEAAKKFPKMSEADILLALSVTVQDYISAEISAGRIDREKLLAELQSDAASASPEVKKELTSSAEAIDSTAKKYKGGVQIPPSKTGLINTEQQA